MNATLEAVNERKAVLDQISQDLHFLSVSVQEKKNILSKTEYTRIIGNLSRLTKYVEKTSSHLIEIAEKKEKPSISAKIQELKKSMSKEDLDVFLTKALENNSVKQNEQD